MKKHTITLPMLIFIAALLVSMAVFPTTASGSTGDPDAVAGSGASLYLDSGAETFNVIASAQAGGVVVPSVSDSAAGKTVSFSVDPSSGYETASVAAITAAGNMLQVVRVEGEQYSFVMPEEAVVIDVTFQYTRT
ncbi:MAG TPA: hypothetical protein IAD42_03280 [Candidatus Scatomorpha pullistercoris]|uniref:Uncharacterized protein n=1 Tax=Candidatus Scatomorpha pullistercoris TaxID=2840929 RepID=A0A9D1G3Q3_9FIRM|nr:hypothetical protein [Candidatus Scatomorpha pullistercoris]